MAMEKESGRENFVKWFSELTNKDVAIAGGKGASLAEMYNHKFPIPPGFVITAQAYEHFIEKTVLKENIHKILSRLNIEQTSELQETSKKIRELIDGAVMPADLKDDILEAYEILDVDKQAMRKAKAGALDILRTSHEPPFVAVRSSATTEDLADASFAGQQDTFLGVKGKDELIEKVKQCFSSLFTARAIYYRKKKGFDHEKARLAVVVQKMINSQKSGVIFSKNPLKNDDSIVIEAVWGLGEGIVSGKILPDNYVLNRDLDILDMKIADKKIALVRNSSGKINEAKLIPERSTQQVLTGHELKLLAQYSLDLERHYEKPQDIEFAIADDEIYIVQSRPITTHVLDNDREITGSILLSGLGASPGIAFGTVRIVNSLEDLNNVKTGDVLVTTMTNPDMVVSMQKAAAIITDEGGITSHAAIVSREMGIPCVVGTRSATQILKEGQIITVDGFTGRVIDGKAQEKKVEIKQIIPTRTKIKVILDLPDYAERAALSGCSEVGLVRLEGIIATSGKHPVWYIKNDSLKEYISVLSAGLKKIALPFKEIWIRTSDIRSDEYVNLQGAPQKQEGNPMLGDHGARFSVRNIDLLAAEFSAIKEIADEFQDKIFGIMMPQIISVSEIQTAKKVAEEIKMPENTKIGIMVETPASVQIINELCEEGISFVSFGTNDLTQYTLAIDRNNSEVQELYNEMHPAVLHSISYVIRRCKKYGVETSICGQAGSKEDMVRFLVGEGIDSISANADAAHKVSQVVASLEQISSPIKEEMRTMSKPNSLSHQTFNINTSSAPHPDIATEEEAILSALEELPSSEKDEYNPGIGRVSDMPSLNDAITVDSQDFEEDKKDKVLDIF